MNAADTDPQLASEVQRIKRMAIRHHARIWWAIGACLVAGLAVGLVTWFSERPTDRDDAHAGLAFGLGGAAFFIGCLLCRGLFPKPRAECPKCGCDWNQESENDVQRWLAWHACPGCGLRMSDDIDSDDKPNSRHVPR